MKLPIDRIFVFYAGLLYGEYTKPGYKVLQVQGPLELYNGAYICGPGGWFRMDGTPCLLDDVPKELLTYLLLLT